MSHNTYFGGVAKFTSADYAAALCEELGPHFRFVANVQVGKGFIYCEHYWGRGFMYLNNNPAKADRRRHYYPGAVARVEEDSIVILDQTQSNGPPHCYADLERIQLAQPNFLERFVTIREVHKRVCKSRKLRSDGMHRITP